MRFSADYQHAVRPIWFPVITPDTASAGGADVDGPLAAAGSAPLLSRIKVPIGRRPDVSSMLGSVGQHGWKRKFDGKSSAFRDNASPCIYVPPSLNRHVRTLFNFHLNNQMIQYVWSVSPTDKPTACAALLAESATSSE